MKRNETYTYCKRLKELREGNGWSLQQAADKLDEAKSTLNSYETAPVYGKKDKRTEKTHRAASVEFLLKACDVYGVTLDYLCGRSPTQAATLEKAAIREYTGLSEAAIDKLNLYKTRGEYTSKLQEPWDIGYTTPQEKYLASVALKAVNLTIEDNLFFELLGRYFCDGYEFVGDTVKNRDTGKTDGIVYFTNKNSELKDRLLINEDLIKYALFDRIRGIIVELKNKEDINNET
ncbi:MAG: helix-turn-helix transcriptional regulator [Oscillospiraceae bacterium]|nr:helix-turn-helix transcriptional regulator [Oscillospiraceae bacterium]